MEKATGVVDDEQELSIALDKVWGIIELAGEFEVKDAPTDEEPGSNAGDDRMIDVLEDTTDDSTMDRLKTLIDDLSVEEQCDLVALMWLGRGDETSEDWTYLREEAVRSHNETTALYLLGTPLLAGYLEEGLNKLGRETRASE